MRTPDSTTAQERKTIARGTDEVQCLLRRLHESANSACADSLDDDDTAGPRDYRALAEMLASNLAENLGYSAAAHREGYLRALTHLMSLVDDGSGPPQVWDPNCATEAAFAAPAQVQAAVARLQTA